MNPVSAKDVPDYHSVIKKPICLRDIQYKLRKHCYMNFRHFELDLLLIVENCTTYNKGKASAWLIDQASELWKVYQQLCAQHATALQEVMAATDADQSAPTAQQARANSSGHSPGYSPQAMTSMSPGYNSSSGRGQSPHSASPAFSGGISPASSASMSPVMSPGYSDPGYSSEGGSGPSPKYDGNTASGQDGGVYSEEEEDQLTGPV